ncbi:Alpha-amylase A type-3 [Cryomyces minteri]|uniref:alpha-amylase n=1 Tax=Cryomyces minteri TaxID=331657 RepID=A0A4U0WFT9_9PEZI|nr:Alpha-amylase A type-3 [Cryomyces minteri]
MKAVVFAAALALASSALAATPAQWRGRSIYQVLTDRFARADGSTTATCNTGDRVYCGGTYQGIIKQLDYIQGMGFSAVWISPVTYNLPQTTVYGQAYHGYWQQDLHRLNPNFGTPADLKALSSALHARGMYLMVDIVVNHFGWDGSSSSVNYSSLSPFNDQKYYHTFCNVDYSNQDSIEDCWLGDSNVELPDLKTGDTTVAKMYNNWINSLVSSYNIDGLRIDTAKHVDKAFWAGFEAAAGVFMTGEVFSGDPTYVCPYQTYLDSVLNYPLYYAATNAFQSTSGNMPALANMISTMKSTCKDTTLLGSFTENHDVARFGQLNGDLSAAQNVLALTLLADGIPIVYAGQEQHYQSFGGSGDPYNREATWYSSYSTTAPLYTLTTKLNALRDWAVRADAGYVTYRNSAIYSDTTTVAMRKGNAGKQVVTVLSNKGSAGASYAQTIGNTGFAANAQVVEVLTCETVTADGSGAVTVPMASGLPRVYYPKVALAGSKICGL